MACSKNMTALKKFWTNFSIFQRKKVIKNIVRHVILLEQSTIIVISHFYTFLDSGQPSQHIVEIQPQSKVNETSRILKKILKISLIE